MGAFVNIEGRTFGRLTVLRRSARSVRGAVLWTCLCKCGQVVDVRGNHLRRGATRSCGCLQTLRGTAFRSRVCQYKNVASKFGRTWSLSEAEAFALFKQNCEWCAAPPANVAKAKCGETFVYNGLDRRDNGRGYEIGNVVPCCARCNTAKSDMTIAEWVEFRRRLITTWCGTTP